jgi:glycosyltransferase involved in cell wall biosynthesis
LANRFLGYPPSDNVEEVAYLSTFPPRKCGIATFTADLVNAINKLKVLQNQIVVSVNGRRLFRSPYEATQHKISRDFEEDYRLTAEFLNRTSIDAVNIQHEFGIFGGEAGEYILDFLRRIRKPVATTLHTVLPHFEGRTRQVFDEILEESSALVVLNETTRNLLSNYGVEDEKVRVIPHGCPDLPLVPSDEVKAALGLKSKVVLSTFGLLSRGKGIEYVIDALPKLLKKEPRIVYYVLGVTHPQVKQNEGEEYRNMLHAKVKKLGLRNNVRFLNRFLSKPELYSYLQATDVYLTPYVSPDQVSSGTLSYALAAGKAVVSTPYLHAKEALGNRRGMFCDFKDSNSIAKKVSELIENSQLRLGIGKRAYQYSRAFSWSNVARKYLELFNDLTLTHEVKIPSNILQ